MSEVFLAQDSLCGSVFLHHPLSPTHTCCMEAANENSAGSPGQLMAPLGGTSVFLK